VRARFGYVQECPSASVRSRKNVQFGARPFVERHDLASKISSFHGRAAPRNTNPAAPLRRVDEPIAPRRIHTGHFCRGGTVFRESTHNEETVFGMVDVHVAHHGGYDRRLERLHVPMVCVAGPCHQLWLESLKRFGNDHRGME
jgi:hypothetical protein